MFWKDWQLILLNCCCYYLSFQFGGADVHVKDEEPEKNTRVITLPNLTLGPDCGDSCAVNGRFMERDTKTQHSYVTSDEEMPPDSGRTR